MEQRKDCVHFKYINKRISLWKRLIAKFNNFRFLLFAKTNGKIDLGVSHTLKKISKKLIWENLDAK